MDGDRLEETCQHWCSHAPAVVLVADGLLVLSKLPRQILAVHIIDGRHYSHLVPVVEEINI